MHHEENNNGKTSISSTLRTCLDFAASWRLRNEHFTATFYRFIVSHLNAVPLESLLPVLLTHLPLKEDPDEYEMVFKAFSTLYSNNPAETVNRCLPKILESIVGFYGMKDANKEKVNYYKQIAKLLL